MSGAKSEPLDVLAESIEGRISALRAEAACLLAIARERRKQIDLLREAALKAAPSLGSSLSVSALLNTSAFVAETGKTADKVELIASDIEAAASALLREGERLEMRLIALRTLKSRSALRASIRERRMEQKENDETSARMRLAFKDEND